MILRARLDELGATYRLADDRVCLLLHYGKKHSRLNAPPPEMPGGIKLNR